jgi:uncharacterized protein (TIGR01777 family)
VSAKDLGVPVHCRPMAPRKVVLAGGSGQVGTLLARHFHAAGDDVVVLSRVPRPAPWRVAPWDAGASLRAGGALGEWRREVDGADAVFGLAGRSVDCRYTAANRRLILDSRVDSTRALGAAIAAAAAPPRVWLQASTATIYAHTFGAAHDEANGVLGGTEPGAPATWRFSIDVAKAWEAAANERPLPRTRLVLLRSAMTMSADRGGIFDVLLRLVRFGLGGTPGDGRQFVSWIHGADFVRACAHLLARDDLSGPVNVAAPEPLPFREFLRALRAAWGTPIGVPAPRWLLELGAFVLRTETELVLKSRRVAPGRLLANGFTFAFPHWPAAATDLVRAWRERRGRARAGSRADA